MAISKETGKIDVNKLEAICKHYTSLRAALIGDGTMHVYDAGSSEDILHDAILRVSTSGAPLTDPLAQVRAEFNAIAKGNRIREQFLTEYNDGVDTTTQAEELQK